MSSSSSKDSIAYLIYWRCSDFIAVVRLVSFVFGSNNAENLSRKTSSSFKLFVHDKIWKRYKLEITINKMKGYYFHLYLNHNQIHHCYSYLKHQAPHLVLLHFLQYSHLLFICCFVVFWREQTVLWLAQGQLKTSVSCRNEKVG